MLNGGSRTDSAQVEIIVSVSAEIPFRSLQRRQNGQHLSVTGDVVSTNLAGVQ